MLGYCSNGYRLGDLEENKFVTDRDAIFDLKKTAAAFVRDLDFYQADDIIEDKEEDGFEKELSEEIKEENEKRIENNDTVEITTWEIGRKKNKARNLEEEKERSGFLGDYRIMLLTLIKKKTV